MASKIEPDYVDYFKQGSGIGQHIVVFDSEPQGATVRLTSYINYSSNDPFLEKMNDNILEDKIPFAARLYQGWYWAVFKWDGKVETRKLIVDRNDVVKVVYSKKWFPTLRPFAVPYICITFPTIIIVLRLFVKVLQKKRVFVTKENVQAIKP